jgi:hypothetical protein
MNRIKIIALAAVPLMVIMLTVYLFHKSKEERAEKMVYYTFNLQVGVGHRQYPVNEISASELNVVKDRALVDFNHLIVQDGDVLELTLGKHEVSQHEMREGLFFPRGGDVERHSNWVLLHVWRAEISKKDDVLIVKSFRGQQLGEFKNVSEIMGFAFDSLIEDINVANK